MSYNFEKLKKEVSDIEDWLAKELSGIRTGLASISILDNVKVDNYGSLSPINQVANITKEDAKTIRISPWDQSQIQPLEKALTEADLGISVAVDDKGIRMSFPELTSERRQDFVKMAKVKLEQAKISLRGGRDAVWNELQLKEKEGEIGQDEKFQLKDEMQKIIDNKGIVLVELFEKKEKEIME
jgi:ribosome recycling factor